MKRFQFFFLAAILVFGACQRENPVRNEAENSPELGVETPKRAVVKFTEDVISDIDSDEFGLFAKEYGVVSASRVFSENERFKERHERAGLHQWYYLEINPDIMPLTKATKAISELPYVEYAEPERGIKRYAASNDKYYGNQWHLKQANGVDINVESVWSAYTVGDKNVIVSVVDGGIDPDHPDLVDNTLPGGQGKSKNFVFNNYKINGDDHGSHVAGIIAAARNNGIGVAGIAGGDAALGIPGVSLMSCQIFDTDRDGNDRSGNIADAIVWGADNGAVISQNSWGYNFDYDGDGYLDAEEKKAALDADISPEHQVAIDYFIDNAGCDKNGNQLPDSPMKGGLVIFAAGNDALENGAPAHYDRVIAVGAVDSDGYRSYFSNFGDWVDICAPGSDVYSTVDGGYAYMSGTSMACPVVSGVAALVLSHRGGQGFTNDMLRECLINGAAANKIEAKRVGPFLDAMGAMSYGMDVAVPEAVDFSAEAFSNRISVSWNLGETVPYGFVLYCSMNRASIEGLNPAKPARDVKTVDIPAYEYAPGTSMSTELTDLKFDSDYYLSLVPYNYGPKYAATMPEAKSVRTEENKAAQISANIDTENIVLKSSENILIKFSVIEPDNHNFSVSWVVGSVAEQWVQMNLNSVDLRINAAAVDEGSYECVLKVTDEYGLESEYHVRYKVLPNRAPVIAEALENVLMSVTDKAGVTIELNGKFADPDEDKLSYEIVNTTPRAVHAIVDGDKLYLTPRESCKTELVLRAKDPRGASAEQSFSLVIREKDEVVSVYPTQVIDYLYVGAQEDLADTSVKIVSESGAVVYDEIVKSSVFEPAKIDMSVFAPGIYSVDIVTDGKNVRKNIVKL